MKTLQPHGEYRVATQGLDHDADGPVHKPPRLVEVPREANFDTRPRQYAQAGLGGRVAQVPSREVLRFSSYDIDDDDDTSDRDTSFYNANISAVNDDADTILGPMIPDDFRKNDVDER